MLEHEVKDNEPEHFVRAHVGKSPGLNPTENVWLVLKLYLPRPFSLNLTELEIMFRTTCYR